MLPPLFPITQVDRIVRRTLFTAGMTGVVAIVAAITLGYPLVAPGIVIGLVLAVVNHRAFQSSAMRYIDPEGSISRKPFAGSVFVRLALCSAIAVALLVWVRPMGWGVVISLALFQAIMLGNSIVALIGYQRSETEVGS